MLLGKYDAMPPTSFALFRSLLAYRRCAILFRAPIAPNSRWPDDAKITSLSPPMRPHLSECRQWPSDTRVAYVWMAVQGEWIFLEEPCLCGIQSCFPSTLDSTSECS